MIEYREDELVEQEKKATNMFKKIFDEKQKWPLHSGKWKRLKSHFAFKNAKNIKAISIQLYSNKDKTILPSLTFPFFLQLRQLNLKNNGISSGEQISTIFAPNLQFVCLADNNICNIKNMRKCKWKKLINFNIYANYVTEGCELVKSDWKIRQLIMGINCMVSFGWVNKADSKMEKISMENNRSTVHSSIGSWKYDEKTLYL